MKYSLSIRQKVRSGTLPLSLQYICNWLVRWKHEPACFFREWWIAFQYHRVWRQSFEKATEPLDQGNPWLAGNVIAFLRAEVKPFHTVFEWGSGSSTFFWAAYAAQVETIEHDPAWHDRVQKVLSLNQIRNVHAVCVHPEISKREGNAADPNSFSSHRPEWDGYQFERYVTIIEDFADSSFDWVCIDGRARPSCLLAAKPKVKPGGWMMLDNSRRDHYQSALRGFASWRHVRISGPVCGSRSFVETLFLQKPNVKKLKVAT